MLFRKNHRKKSRKKSNFRKKSRNQSFRKKSRKRKSRKRKPRKTKKKRKKGGSLDSENSENSNDLEDLSQEIENLKKIDLKDLRQKEIKKLKTLSLVELQKKFFGKNYTDSIKNHDEELVNDKKNLIKLLLSSFPDFSVNLKKMDSKIIIDDNLDNIRIKVGDNDTNKSPEQESLTSGVGSALPAPAAGGGGKTAGAVAWTGRGGAGMRLRVQPRPLPDQEQDVLNEAQLQRVPPAQGRGGWPSRDNIDLWGSDALVQPHWTKITKIRSMTPNRAWMPFVACSIPPFENKAESYRKLRHLTNIWQVTHLMTLEHKSIPVTRSFTADLLNPVMSRNAWRPQINPREHRIISRPERPFTFFDNRMVDMTPGNLLTFTRFHIFLDTLHLNIRRFTGAIHCLAGMGRTGSMVLYAILYDRMNLPRNNQNHYHTGYMHGQNNGRNHLHFQFFKNLFVQQAIDGAENRHKPDFWEEFFDVHTLARANMFVRRINLINFCLCMKADHHRERKLTLYYMQHPHYTRGEAGDLMRHLHFYHTYTIPARMPLQTWYEANHHFLYAKQQNSQYWNHVQADGSNKIDPGTGHFFRNAEGSDI